MIKFFKTITFSTFLFYLLFSNALANNINSVIIYAVDVSGSYRNIYHENLKIADRVEKNSFKFLNKLVGVLESDISFKALAITDLSSLGDVLCEVRIARKSFFKPTKKLKGIKKKQFYTKFLPQQCSPAIKAAPTSRATDISGTIDLGANLARSETNGEIIMVLLSDFFEYKPEEMPKFKFNLKGIKFVLIYRNILDTKNTQWKLTQEEAKKWKTILEDAGAEKVVIVDERSSQYTDKVMRDLF